MIAHAIASMFDRLAIEHQRHVHHVYQTLSSLNTLYIFHAHMFMSHHLLQPHHCALQLQVGDVLLVQGDTAVSTGQSLARWFGDETAKAGSANCVHAALVCSGT
jgi:hypothetical protein